MLQFLNKICPIESVLLVKACDGRYLYRVVSADGTNYAVKFDPNPEEQGFDVERNNMTFARNILGSVVPKIIYCNNFVLVTEWIDGRHPDGFVELASIRVKLRDRTIGKDYCISNNDPRLFIHDTNIKSSDEWMKKRIDNVDKALKILGLHKELEWIDAHEPVFFQHNDLHSKNIVVDDSGEIVGVLDWECAGFYPEHYEITRLNALEFAHNLGNVDQKVQTIESFLLECEILKYTRDRDKIKNILCLP